MTRRHDLVVGEMRHHEIWNDQVMILSALLLSVANVMETNQVPVPSPGPTEPLPKPPTPSPGPTVPR